MQAASNRQQSLPVLAEGIPKGMPCPGVQLKTTHTGCWIPTPQFLFLQGKAGQNVNYSSGTQDTPLKHQEQCSTNTCEPPVSQPVCPPPLWRLRHSWYMQETTGSRALLKHCYSDHSRGQDQERTITQCKMTWKVVKPCQWGLPWPWYRLMLHLCLKSRHRASIGGNLCQQANRLGNRVLRVYRSFTSLKLNYRSVVTSPFPYLILP